MNQSIRHREELKQKTDTINDLLSQLQKLQQASKRLKDIAQESKIAIPADIADTIDRSYGSARYIPLHAANNGLELLATRASIVLGVSTSHPDQDHEPIHSQPPKRVRRERVPVITTTPAPTTLDQLSTDPRNVDYRDVIAWLRSQPSES